MDSIKYITNKDLLAEIHRSKNSFCRYDAPEYSRYDVIVTSLDLITPELIEQVLARKSEVIAKKGPAGWTGAFPEEPVTKDTLVFRLMTDEHIPPDDGRRRRRAGSTSTAIKTNFPPFKHYVLRDDAPVEVGRSHWIGSVSNGHFSEDHGKMNNRLATMFMLLVERYARRGNWRSYTYNDEMRSQALLQLAQVGLQFDESKSDNPFAFYTQCIKTCFIRILNSEKKNQHIRDDLLIMAGATPSFTRQIEHELEQRFGDQKDITTPAATTQAAVIPAPKKRGRKPKQVTV